MDEVPSVTLLTALSVEDPHTRLKVAMNSQRMGPSVFLQDRETSVEFSSFLVKFVFCIGNFEDLVVGGDDIIEFCRAKCETVNCTTVSRPRNFRDWNE